MVRTIISEGKTTAEAIEKGLKELKTSRENVEVRVLEEKKKSFFNILDPHIVKVEITEKEGKKESKVETEEEHKLSSDEIQEAKEEIEKFLKKFLKGISSKITYSVVKDGEFISVIIEGEEASKLIGYRGETLNALQLILINIAEKKINQRIKVIVDIENYRAKREKTLKELASKIERTVNKTGKNVTLEPMTPYERKVIHAALQNSDYVKTYSIGENNHRRVVISKK